MPPTRTIAVCTSSRADWSHLIWPIRAMRARPEIDARIIAIGAHLAPGFGRTESAMAGDDLAPDERIECLLDSDTDIGMAKTIGVAILGLTDVLARMRPDLLLLIADRYEMLAPAAVATALRIPMAHIEGGEVSEGAIDQQVRNALTMLSHLHFAPTELAARRLVAMGEEPWRVHAVGAPSLDHLRHLPPHDRAATARARDLDPTSDWAVVAWHPVTLDRDTTSETDPVLTALERLDDLQLVFCYPNADAGSRAILDRVRSFCAAHPRSRLFVNLDPPDYLDLLRGAALMIGNSSSGIMESPALRLPAVNIGRRQQGRQRASNVLDAPAEAAAVLESVARARDVAFRASLADMSNPYGDGRAGSRIAEHLATVPIDDRLRRKPAPPVDSLCAHRDDGAILESR